MTFTDIQIHLLYFPYNKSILLIQCFIFSIQLLDGWHVIFIPVHNSNMKSICINYMKKMKNSKSGKSNNCIYLLDTC